MKLTSRKYSTSSSELTIIKSFMDKMHLLQKQQHKQKN